MSNINAVSTITSKINLIKELSSFILANMNRSKNKVVKTDTMAITRKIFLSPVLICSIKQ